MIIMKDVSSEKVSYIGNFSIFANEKLLGLC